MRTVVRHAATGEPVPCRVYFRSADGVPYPPHGHRGHINSDGNTWNLDIGGDVRLGATTYSYIDGTCEGWLPLGEVTVEAARGCEYDPLRTTVTIRPGQAGLELMLTRLTDLAATGWYSGDTHVHFVSTLGGELEARGEDVRVTNLLLSQWGHLFTNAEEFTGHPRTSADGHSHVFAGQENRSGMLGHFNLLGLRRPVMPWCTGSAEESELGGGLETALSHWADECHEQGGTVVLAHFSVPNGEAAAVCRRDDRLGPVQHPGVLPLPQRGVPGDAGQRHGQVEQRGADRSPPHLRPRARRRNWATGRGARPCARGPPS
ncbi:CehA/McbA family metallohydrolase domain-containing protein [Nonomuraea wenchangensis]|uniref:Uncharacterized protein n=1 Tax=Nonomuraea wenchangensis TaxID=568860 RepID=A0A1I0LVK8_9ACTN|nr:hypothetical protein [Nonomuraea wenchangensis]SEU47867.1 hypothetical protein SAMN05421811_13230 [Nonomuraea wenchangensis]